VRAVRAVRGGRVSRRAGVRRRRRPPGERFAGRAADVPRVRRVSRVRGGRRAVSEARPVPEE